MALNVKIVKEVTNARVSVNGSLENTATKVRRCHQGLFSQSVVQFVLSLVYSHHKHPRYLGREFNHGYIASR